MSADWRSRPLPLPPRRLRTMILTLLAVDAVTAWVVIIGVYTFLERAWRGLGARLLATSPIETHLAQLETVRRLQGLAWVATVVIFLLWVHRAHRHLSTMGVRGLEFTPRSAVNGFLLPLANLVLALRAMAELYSASDPDWSPAEDGRAAAVPPVIVWWWALFVAATLADPPWRSLLGSVDDVAVGGPTLALLAGQLAYIASAVLAIAIVRTVDRRQTERVEAGTGG